MRIDVQREGPIVRVTSPDLPHWSAVARDLVTLGTIVRTGLNHLERVMRLPENERLIEQHVQTRTLACIRCNEPFTAPVRRGRLQTICHACKRKTQGAA